MTIRFAVTFEFDTRAPLTHRGAIAGTKVATCVARAIRTAQAVLKPQNWSSLNCVVLERLYEARAAAGAPIRTEASPEAVPTTIIA